MRAPSSQGSCGAGGDGTHGKHRADPAMGMGPGSADRDHISSYPGPREGTETWNGLELTSEALSLEASTKGGT